jgi:hypothetical protein
MRELEEASVDWMLDCRAVSIHTAFFMGQAEQQKLAQFIERGGRLFLSGELPTVDLEMKPCTTLKDVVERASRDRASGDRVSGIRASGDGASGKRGQVLYQRENLFADGRFADRLVAAGIEPRITCSEQFRIMVHYSKQDGGKQDGSEQDRFVYFFHLADGSANQAWLEIDGERIEMRLGSKTCGVLRIADEKIIAHLVKGHNEIDETVADVRIQYGAQTIEGRGDFVG